MNVVSYFDGMSCGQLALQREGIKVTNYFACEIDKYSSSRTMVNFPNTIQLGDVTKTNLETLPKIDLFIGGSPCQGFSFAGKQLNFSDPRSKLFFEFAADLRYIQEFINPNVKFLLENVKMKKEYQNVISRFLGVQPVEINSARVSAQNRKRLYWTNICEITQPEDKGILLKDIVHEHTDFEPLSKKGTSYMLTGSEKWAAGSVHRLEENLDYPDEKSHTLCANMYKGIPYNCYYQSLNEFIVSFEKTLQILEKEVERGKIKSLKKDSQSNNVYYTVHGQNIKILTPPTTTNDVTTINPRKADGSQTDQQDRIYTSDGKMVALSAELQGRFNVMIPNEYIFGCIAPDRINKKQNGRRFNEGTKFYTLTAQDKHGILIEGYIRKLTPIECERLQTVPDNYTAGVSNSQRYKMLGNGWTVDVIAHIFKGLKNDDFNENLDF